VQHGKDDVERGGERVAVLRQIGAGAASQGVCGAPLRGQGRDVERLAAAQDGGGGGELKVGLTCGAELCRRGAVEQALGLRAAEPAALLVDGDGDDIVALAVDGLEDGGGREQRDLVLAGAAAKENSDAESFLHGAV